MKAYGGGCDEPDFYRVIIAISRKNFVRIEIKNFVSVEIVVLFTVVFITTESRLIM